MTGLTGTFPAEDKQGDTAFLFLLLETSVLSVVYLIPPFLLLLMTLQVSMAL